MLYSCSESTLVDLAYKYIQTEEYNEALKYANAALRKNSESYFANLYKGICLFGLENDVESLEYFSKAASIEPQNPYPYTYRAESYMQLKKYNEALADYNTAYDFVTGSGGQFPVFRIRGHNDVDLYSLLANRGIAYYFLDDYKAAFNDFSNCIDQNKYLDLCYYWRACVYLDLGATDKGCADLQKAVELNYPEAAQQYEKYCNCRK
jgi:tetratricopeptide (TPR) repeat protein